MASPCAVVKGNQINFLIKLLFIKINCGEFEQRDECDEEEGSLENNNFGDECDEKENKRCDEYMRERERWWI